MLKIKSILVSLLAVVALASCSNENLEENPEVEGGGDKAWALKSIINLMITGRISSPTLQA